MQAQAPTFRENLESKTPIGIVSSDSLYRTEDMGYSLLVTRDAIIGAKKPRSSGEFEAYLGPGSKVTDAARAVADEMAEKLTGTREFSVSIGSIEQILLKRPGYFFGGYMIIKTGARWFRIDIRLLSVGSSQLLDAYNILADSFRIAVGPRVYIKQNPFPAPIDWPWARENRIVQEGHMTAILAMVNEHKNGMSNAEIDAALSDYSQWMTVKHLRELTIRGLIEYKPELFGDPGKYFITDLGISTMRETTV